ncbi:MAG: hypothetical protein ACE5FU_15115, partial [Nitrospinota bacterium]
MERRWPDRQSGPSISPNFFRLFFFVTLCAKTTSSKPPLPFDLVDISGVEKIIPTMDIIVGHGLFFHKYRFKKREGQKIIIDLYNIFLTENAILYKDYPEELKSYSYQLDLYKLNFQLLLGDHFLCANTPQFHFLTGMLTALNKINISNLESIPITIIPFGIDETEATSEKRALKGVHPGIDAKDKVLLWGGGIWDWLDPFTVIRAMKLLSQKRDDIKLFFMGINSPTHGVVVSSKAPLIQMTKEMGLFKTS